MRFSRLMCCLCGWLAMTVLVGCQANTPGSQETPEVQTAPGLGGDTQQLMDDPDAPTEFTTTSTGLQHRILRKGSDRKPASTDTVECHYEGKLDDGTVFDSSYKRGKPASFPLDGVIAGWTEGLQLIGEGGKIELNIPFELAYGAEGRPPTIPPKARLHFVVELISIQ